MKSVLLIGLGRFGYHTAVKLNELNQDVLAIDINEERVNAVLPYVTNAKIADCTNEAVIKSLGVRNFDVCIVSIGNDFQSSLEITSLLKDYGAPLVVSRASDSIQEKFLMRNGADQVVYPERELANWTAVCFSSELIFDYIPVADGFSIYEIAVPKEWVGKTPASAAVRQKYGMNIVALKSGDTVDGMIKADHVFSADEKVLVIGRDADVKKLLRL